MLGIVLIASMAVVGMVVALTRDGVIRDERSADHALDPVLDPADLAELVHAFDGVEAEHATRRRMLLEVRLRPLVERRVPVRCIEPVPTRHTTRVRFADGTAVTVQGETAGDAGVLASVIRHHSVLPGTCSTDTSGGTHLVFDWSGGRRHLSMLVTGLDQPD